MDPDQSSAEFKVEQSSKKIVNDYEILDLKSSATNDEVKKAYYNQITKYHPDKVSHLGEDLKKFAEKHTLKLNEAYERIKKECGMK